MRHKTFGRTRVVRGAGLYVLMLWCACSWLLSGAVPTMAAPAAGARGVSPGVPSPVAVYVQWLRVDQHHPRTLFVGGTLKCAVSTLARICPSWIMRSTDGGATWADLSVALGTAGAFGVYTLSPVTIAGDGRHIFAGASWNAGSPASTSHGIMRSTDGGLTWQLSGEPGTYGGGYGNLALSPVADNRLYAVYDAGNGGGSWVAYSDDYGATWHSAGNPGSLVPTVSGAGPFGALVADLMSLDTVYANVSDYREYTNAAGYTVTYLHSDVAARSDDKGLHWSIVMTPTASPPLTNFTVSSDPREDGLLVGRTTDRSVPADRRYLSGDGGRTWTSAACPGDAGGACPGFTVDNVFGACAAYGFVRDGIYPFHGRGAAGGRLAISKNLPVHTADLIGVGAGAHPGDPVYLLGSGVRGNVHGLLYRGTDAGKSWQTLPAGEPSALLAP